jgi:hypothetical protein
LNGTVTVQFSTLAANTVAAGVSNGGTAGAALGGALYSLGFNLQNQAASLSIDDSILSNSNSALGTASTVADLVVDAPANVAAGAGGGANVATSTVNYLDQNLIETVAVVNNATVTGGATPLTSDPGLGALTLNGMGLTATLAIGPTSAALDAGVCEPTFTTVDQIGTTRPQGSSCDLGAYELSQQAVTINTNPTGLAFAVSGDAGCDPGSSYAGGAALPWPAGLQCTVTAGSPQTLANTQYQFTGWADGNTTNPRVFTTNGVAASYTANFVQVVGVPDLVDDTASAAESALVAAGLTVGTITMQPSSVYPAGTVISDSAGTTTELPLGTTVNLVVSSGPTEPVSIDLTSVMTLYAFSDVGFKPIDGGLDGFSDAYTALESGNAGAVLDWSGATFSLLGAGVPSAVANTTIAVPQQSYSALEILATGVNGGARQQKLIVNYTDNSFDTFVQSFSDWKHPASYVGEAIAASAPNRVISTGKTQAGVTNIYGYAFMLNGAKTVESLTLPKTADVALLALDLTPAPPVLATTAAPTFSPQPGTYGTATPVTLASTTPGAVIYYTTNGTPPTTSSTLYTGPIDVAITTTLNAIAISQGELTSAVATGAYTITTTAATPVNLAAAYGLYAIAVEGAAALDGGIDGHGDGYAGNLTGTDLTWAGSPYLLGQIGTPSAVADATIGLPPGNYTAISLVGTAVNGSQVQSARVSTTFTVNYQDGSSAKFVQSMSDWHAPQSYAGEQIALEMHYKVTSRGTLEPGKYYLYGYAFPLDPTRVAVSLTLPANRDIVVLAVDIMP